MKSCFALFFFAMVQSVLFAGAGLEKQKVLNQLQLQAENLFGTFDVAAQTALVRLNIAVMQALEDKDLFQRDKIIRAVSAAIPGQTKNDQKTSSQSSTILLVPPATKGNYSSKIFSGLTPTDMNNLTAAEKKQSDQALIDTIKRFGVVKRATVAELNSNFETMFGGLFKKNRGHILFYFGQGNGHPVMVQAFKKVVAKAMQPRTSVGTFLVDLQTKFADGLIQNDFVNIFKPWVLGDFSVFKKAVSQNIDYIVLSYAGAVRVAQPVLQSIKLIDKQKSDEIFANALQTAKSKTNLLSHLYRLLINPEYLHFRSIFDDLPTPSESLSVGTKKSVAGTITENDIAAARAKLKKAGDVVAKEQGKNISKNIQSAVEPLSNNFVSIVRSEMSKIKTSIRQDQLTGNYFARYMFDSSQLFAEKYAAAKINLFKLLRVKVILPGKNIMDYLENDLPKELVTMNDLISFTRSFVAMNVDSAEPEIMWQKMRLNSAFEKRSLLKEGGNTVAGAMAVLESKLGDIGLQHGKQMFLERLVTTKIVQVRLNKFEGGTVEKIKRWQKVVKNALGKFSYDPNTDVPNNANGLIMAFNSFGINALQKAVQSMKPFDGFLYEVLKIKI